MWFSAVQLTIVGMGVTYLFLIIMVYCINFSGLVINKFFPEKPAAAPEETEDEAVVAVIAAAIAGSK